MIRAAEVLADDHNYHNDGLAHAPPGNHLYQRG